MCLGIDLHKRYAQVAVLDQAGELVEEVRVENANLDDLAQRHAGATAAIEERAGSLKETQLLMSIPGVSYYSALTIYAELGEIERFDGDKQVVSYVGLNPVIRESGDPRFEGGIPKKGSGRLR